MESYTSDSPPLVPADRKIAKPRRKNVTPDHRAAILNDLQSEADQMLANADLNTAFNDAARAMSDAVEQGIEPVWSPEERLRLQYGGALQVVVNRITTLIPFKNLEDANQHYSRSYNSLTSFTAWIDDKPIKISARALTRDWEEKVWQRTWENDWDMDKYANQMETEIANLEIWITHFDSELDGYGMFCEHFYRHFKDDITLLKEGVTEEKKAAKVNEISGVDTVKPPMSPSSVWRSSRREKLAGMSGINSEKLPFLTTSARHRPRLMGRWVCLVSTQPSRLHLAVPPPSVRIEMAMALPSRIYSGRICG
jgi:hypothetical protein